MRRFFAVQFVLLALGTAPAHAAIGARAADRPPASLTETVSTAHFLIHYSTTQGDPNAVTATAAQTLAANAEEAYAAEVGQWGYAAPADDGDGHVDVYVFVFPAQYAMYAGMAWAVSSHVPYPGEIWIAVNATTSKSVVAHEFFHVLQFGIYPLAPWLMEATARWAEHQLFNSSDFSYLQHADAPLDCQSSECPSDACDGGYRR